MPPRGRIAVEGVGPVALRPQAAITDTFTNAGAASGSKLAQLAQALGQAAPALQQFASTVTDRGNKKAAAEGDMAARQDAEAKLDYRDAVKSRKIAPHQNPFFIQSYKKTAGEIMAGSYHAALQAAWKADEGLANTTDTGAFDTFESNFRTQWLKDRVGETRDLHFESGFGHMVDGYTQDERTKFASAVGARVEAQAGDLFGARQFDILQSHLKDGADATVEMLNLSTKEYLSVNPLAGRVANLKTAQAVADYAVQSKDKAALDLLDKIAGGPNGESLGLREEVREIRQKAARQIVSDKMDDLRLADGEYDADRREKRIAYGRDFSVAALADPLAVKRDRKTWLLRYAQEVSPLAEDIDTQSRLIDSAADQTYDGDEGKFQRAYLLANGYNPDTGGAGHLSYRQADELLANRDITAAQHGQLIGVLEHRVDRAYMLKERAESDAKEGKGPADTKLFSDPLFNLHESTVRSAFPPSPAGTREAPEVSARRAAAVTYYANYYARLATTPEWGKLTLEQKQNTLAYAAQTAVEVGLNTGKKEDGSNSRYVKRVERGREKAGVSGPAAPTSAKSQVDVVAPALISRLSKSVVAMAEGRATKLPDDLKTMLREHGVKVSDPAVIQTFIKAQQKAAAGR